MSEQIPRSVGDPDPESPPADGTGRYSTLIGSGAGALAALLGLTVLWGYLTNNVPLVQIRPDFTPMQVNVAALFLLSGAALLLLSGDHRRAGHVGGGLVTVIAGLTLFEWVSGTNLGLDSILRPLFPHYHGLWLARFAPITGIAFCAAGAAIGLSHRPAGWHISQLPGLLGALVIALGAATLVGYVSGPKTTYAFMTQTRMAAHTAAGLVALGAGIIALCGRLQKEAHPAQTQRWLLLPAGMTIAAVLLWRALVAQEEAQIERMVHAKLIEASKDIAAELDSHVWALSRLAHRIELYRPTEEEWARDAQMYLKEMHYQTVAWIAPSFSPRRVVVAHGDLARRAPELAAVVSRWRSQTAPLEQCESQIIHERGVPLGVATLAAVVPICQDGAVAGLVIGVLDADELLDAALANRSEPPYRVTILEDRRPIYRSSGNREAGGGAALLWEQHQDLKLYALRWVMQAAPTALLLDEAQSLLSQAALGGGLLVALMLSLTVHLWRAARQRTEEAGRASAALSQESAARQRAQEAERDQAHIFETVLKSMDDGVVVADRTGVPQFFNPAARRMLGVGPAEDIARRPLDSYDVFRADQSHRPADEMLFIRAVGGETITEDELYIHRAGTPGRWVSCNAGPIVDEAGHSKGGVVVFRDVTEQRMAADERGKVARMKDEFISTVSHELRTPLTSIRGSLGLIAAGHTGIIPPEAQQMLDIAVSNTDRLVRLINDILDIERMESGDVALEKRECSVAELMHAAGESLLHLAGQAGVTLEVCPCAALLWADPDRIAQVLTNLIGNAIKFSPPGSAIRLSAERRGHELVLMVADQGRGIPADKLESIFGRFQQVDSSDARDKGGTGLGLAICRSIALQHGARLWVETALGLGSTFFFALPLSPEGPAASPAPPVVLVGDADRDMTAAVSASR